jgi:competence protein ComK
MMGKFKIDENVCCILPFYNEFGELCSKIIKVDEELKIKLSPLKLIEASCINYGSTMRGRIDAISYLTGYKKRVPLTISIAKEIYAFPINSHLRSDEIWIFTNHVLKYNKVDNSTTKIIFRNLKTLNVQISYSSFHSQFNRSIACIYQLNKNLL